MSFQDETTEWMNPPPPGTSDENSTKEKYLYDTKRDVRRYSRSPSHNRYHNRSRSRSHERHSRHTRDRRRRSRSRDCYYRSRSGSQKMHSERKYSHKSRKSKHSRSRSRSRSKHLRKSYSRSRSSSRRRRRTTRSRSYSSSSDRESYQGHSRHAYGDKPNTKTLDIDEDDEELESVQENTFKNDGSFLEMFKKMQEEQAKTEVKSEEPEAGASEVKKLPFYGKRRGGRILKTGVVQKARNPNDLEDEPKDAWSVYMKEVRKYKEACCDDDSKTRPLVK